MTTTPSSAVRVLSWLYNCNEKKPQYDCLLYFRNLGSNFVFLRRQLKCEDIRSGFEWFDV